MQRALDWIKRHRAIVAAIAAAWVVLKLGRWLVGGAWAFREWIPWGDVGPWLADHWLLGVIAAASLFALVFMAVRALIGVLDRRRERKRVAAPAEREVAETPGRPQEGALVPGDPLAPSSADAHDTANLSRR